MLSTSVPYARPTDELHHSLKRLVFSDAGCHCERDQLAYLAGLLIDDMEEGPIYHVLAWSSHRAKRPF